MGKDIKNKDWGGARTGAGRPSLFKDKRRSINLTLTEKAIKILTDKAQQEGISRSDYINKYLLTIKN